jgi:hypothetical protein
LEDKMPSAAIEPDSFLGHICTQQPLLSSSGKELTRQIPFQRWELSSGRRIPTLAKIAAIDNGNDALKGAMLHAHQPSIRTTRIITAYAPATTLRAGEGVTTWQVNDSEPFWIGDDALISRHVESLPVGLTEERLADGRYQRYLFATLAELLREAGYERLPLDDQGEHDLYISFGVPNEEMTRKGPTEVVRRVLQSIFNKPVRIRRTDEQGRVTSWLIRLVEISPYPQSFASFVTWYYTLDGTPIETDIVKHTTLDIGGGQLHSCEVEIQRHAVSRPKLRMSASLLGEGTIMMARAVSETIRARYAGIHLSDAQAQQVLTQGEVIVGGRRARVDDIVMEVITSRSYNMFTRMLPLLQEGQSYIMITGGGSVLLEQSLRQLVSTKRSLSSYLFVPPGIAPVLNAIGGYVLAQTASQKMLERSDASAIQEREA